VDGLDASGLAAGLRRIRRRRAALALVFLALPLALLAHRHGPWSHPVRTALLLAWVAIYSCTTLMVAWSRCPRCRALFFTTGTSFRVNPLRRECGSCGCTLAIGVWRMRACNDHTATPGCVSGEHRTPHR
jgi:hypothetical protein